ncbi:MAG: hypothetical protein ABUT20_61230, partial [Bacteroidota bacterium]
KREGERLLNYEQIHFDITELYARKIRQQLSSISLDKETFRKNFNSLCFNLIQEMNAFEALYDEEMANSPFSTEIETKWAKQINKELSKLEQFKEPEVHISFAKPSPVFKP